jgi:transcriptional regulator with XRE-family HTH domain
MERATAIMIGTEPAQMRFRLKAKVIEAGYPTFSEFAGKLGVHRVYLSKILNGHEFPSPNMQQKLAKELGLTLLELRGLL